VFYTLTEYITVNFKLAKDIVLEERSETIPFIITICGVYSASPPMVYLLVIDTSLSMDGEKIFRAKQAALKILDLLRDKDYVGVYGFDGKFHKVLEPTPLTNKKEIEDAIVSLKLGSGTNLYETLKRINEEIESIYKNMGSPVVNLVLLTDGQPTVGPKKPEKILKMASKLSKKEISPLIIGVGSDYNEKLLLKIASTLNGLFEHVAKPGALEKIMYEYTVTAREVSARNVVVSIRLRPEFRAIVYNKRFVNVPGGIEVNVGDIHYRESIDLVGDLEVPAMTKGSIDVGEVQVSYVNPETSAVEFTTPIPIRLEVKPLTAVEKVSLSEEVLAKAQVIKTASRIEELLERGRGREVLSELNELVEMTMRVGSRELTSKTMSIKERVEKEGLTPDLSKELASIISRIISGKISESREKGEEK